MKKAVVSILLAAALSGCSVTVAPESRSEQAMNVLEQTQKQDLSHTKIGYGSGTQTDDKNRTTGALDFNRRYGDLNAAAINENEK